MKNTKQILLVSITIISLFFSKESFCQFKNFGIKLGLTLSNASLEPTSIFTDLKYKTGFNASAFYDFLNFKSLTVSLEAGYVQRGYNHLFNITNEIGEKVGEGTLHNTLHYIDLSINGKYFFAYSDLRPYVSVGPEISFYTGYKQKYTSTVSSFFAVTPNPILENLKSSSLGIKLGAGVEIKKLIPYSIIIETMYTPDLIYSYDNGITKFKNRIFEFNLGIKF